MLVAVEPPVCALQDIGKEAFPGEVGFGEQNLG